MPACRAPRSPDRRSMICSGQRGAGRSTPSCAGGWTDSAGLRHLILLLDELTAVGVGFVSLNEGIDTTTPAGRLQLHVLGAIAEFDASASENVCERGWRGQGAGAAAWST